MAITTINAYLNGDVVAVTQILSEVAMIFDGNSFAVAAKAAALIGIIVAILGGILRGAVLPAAAFFWPILVAVLMITPKVDLQVEDRMGGMAVIDDLPVGFAAPISIITTLGAGVSNMLTENLGLDDNAVTMDNGHILSLRAPSVYRTVITEPAWQGDAARFSNGLSPSKDTLTYVIDCLGWEDKSVDSTKKVINLKNRSISDMSVTSADNVTGSNGTVYSCSDMYNALMAGFNSADYATKLRSAINKFFGKYESDTTTGSRYEAALESVVSDKTAFFKAAAFSNAMTRAPAEVTALAAGGASQAASLNDALNQKREKNYGAAAVVFETFSKTTAFMEAWTFSILPLVLIIMMFGAFGVKLGVKYFWMLVWIQFWYPTLLIVIGISDAMMDALPSTMATVAAFDAFMAETLRLQDASYMNLSMASALSMFMVWGASGALGAAFQRDVSGGEHVDPRKTSPDSISRKPLTVYDSLGTVNSATGETAMNYEAGKAFATRTFTIEDVHGVQNAITNGSTFNATGTTGTTSGVDQSRGSNTGKTATNQWQDSVSQSVGFDRATGVSFGRGVQDSGAKGTKAGMQHSSSVAKGYSVSGGVQAGAGAPVGGPVSGGAKAGISGEAMSRDSTQYALGRDISQNDVISKDLRNSQSATGKVSDGSSHVEMDSVAEQQGYFTQDQYREGASVAKSVARSDSQGETKSETEGTSIRTSATIDGQRAAARLADLGLVDKLRSDVDNLGLANDVDKVMDFYGKELKSMYPSGMNAEDARYAFAATYVMQGYSGVLYQDQPADVREQKTELANEVSDKYLMATQIGNAWKLPEGVSAQNLEMFEGVDPKEIANNAQSAIRGFTITEDGAKSAVDNIGSDFNREQAVSAVEKALGVESEKLSKGQLNGILSEWREKLDAEDGEIIHNKQGWMDLKKEIGGFRATQALFRGNEEARMRAIGSQYNQDNGSVLNWDNYRDAPERAQDIFDKRMDRFEAAGVATKDNKIAQYMALTQLQVGAEMNGEQDVANEFARMRGELGNEDKILSDSTETAGRIAAVALRGASEETLKRNFARAEQEYRIGETQQFWESERGVSLNGMGQDVSWSGTSGGGAGKVNPNEVYEYLTGEKGLPDHWAKGIMANIKDESGFDPGAVEGGVARPNKGFGLFQHTDSGGLARRSNMEDYLEQRGLEKNDWRGQIDYAVDVELKTSHQDVFKALEGTSTSQEAANVWMEKFERPHDSVRGARYARYAALD